MDAQQSELVMATLLGTITGAEVGRDALIRLIPEAKAWFKPPEESTAYVVAAGDLYLVTADSNEVGDNPTVAVERIALVESDWRAACRQSEYDEMRQRRIVARDWTFKAERIGIEINVRSERGADSRAEGGLEDSQAEDFALALARALGWTAANEATLR